jgi:hypothetical protein
VQADVARGCVEAAGVLVAVGDASGEPPGVELPSSASRQPARPAPRGAPPGGAAVADLRQDLLGLPRHPLVLGLQVVEPVLRVEHRAADCVELPVRLPLIVQHLAVLEKLYSSTYPLNLSHPKK